MSPRRLLLLGMLALAGCGGGDGGERPPHLILISLDTLNRDALRAYDPEAQELPSIDAFCGESLRFDQAYSAASWTLPAHGSLFTGLYPDRHGATDRRVTLTREAQTLAEGLRARGYQTAGFNGGGYLSQEYGMGRGFEYYDSFDRDKSGPSETGAQLVERVKGFLEKRGNNARPLFLFLHSYAVHNYYDVRPEIAANFPNTDFMPRKEYVHCALGRKDCDPKAWREMKRLYRAELDDFDKAFASLRDELRAAGIWDEAIIVFLTDHGEGFEPQRARKHHGGRLHADQVHIPFFVRIPGQEAGVIDDPVSIVDVLPTLLELSGSSAQQGIDGRSFTALLGRGGTYEPRPIYAMEHYFAWQKGKRYLPGKKISQLPVSSAVIDEDGWYIRHGNGREELYPSGDYEQREALSADAETLQGLRSLVSERVQPRFQSPERGAAPALDKKLNDLGYIDD